MSQSGTLYLIDVYSLMFQVFHAIPTMTSPEGLPTNAVFGFTRDLQAILDDREPDFLVCAMDSHGPAARNEVYAEYKANRSETPDDLIPQIPLIRDVIEGFNVPAVEHAGWEADDIIATLTRQAVDSGLDVRIVTSDKDVRQLLGPKVQVLNLRKNVFQDEQFLMDEWGVRPDQVIDFQSLVGDSVDNVPGVPLVGPKKARALLEQFETLDKVLENAADVKGKKLSENLVTYAEQARISKTLVTLRQDLPIEADWDKFAVCTPNHSQLLELFTTLGFRGFARRMRDAGEPSSNAPREEDFGRIRSEAEWESFVESLDEAERIAIKFNTSPGHIRDCDILGCTFSVAPFQARYVSMDESESGFSVSPDQFSAGLGPLLSGDSIRISAFDIKPTLLILKRLDIAPSLLGIDPGIGDYLVDAGTRDRSFAKLVDRYLDETFPTAGSEKPVQQTMFEDSSAEEFAIEYGRQCETTGRMAVAVEQQLKDEELWKLYDEVERPLVPVLAEMEWTGIKVDTDELKAQSEDLASRLEKLHTEIHELAGHEFNIDSPKQLAVVLFEELGLPIQKRTKTGASTNQEVLEKLAPMHDLPAKIIEHRRYTKLKGTYLDSLPQLVQPDTGRIHASFHQTVAATGRLSSSDPNLQNIPIRTAEGRLIRKAFIPGEDGWKLLSADYSQIELRMLAHFCGDPELVHAFRSDLDIHTQVAADVYDVELNEVTKDQRSVAKAVNFGVIYGQSAFGLAAALGIDQSEAANFIEGYFQHFSRVAEYLEEILDECAADGYARTIMGRRRPISGIRTSNRPSQRNLPERTAINTVIQGSAADLIKLAMIRISQELKESGMDANMLLQIHDELVFEVAEDQLDELAAMVRSEMASAMSLEVPLVVDLGAGDNWLEQTALELN